MPSRVIKGEIVESDSLSRVSLQADLTFRNLLVIVDDFGRFDARPRVLASRLFPTRPIEPDQVMAWLEELEREGAVIFYRVGERPFLRLPNWEKHRANGRRANTSKYPEPVEESPEPPDSHTEIPGDPRKSSTIPGNPPVGRGTRDEGRGTKDVCVNGVDADAPPISLELVGDSPPDAFAEVRAAFALYDKKLTACSSARLRLIRSVIREHGPRAPVEAIHGYRWMHRKRDENGFDPSQHFNPETVFRPSNVSKYIDAYADARHEGAEPPFHVELASQQETEPAWQSAYE